MRRTIATICIMTFTLGTISPFLAAPQAAAMNLGVEDGMKLPEAHKLPSFMSIDRRNQLMNPSKITPEEVPIPEEILIPKEIPTLVEATKPEENLLGDVNQDGIFDVDDVIFIAQIAQGVRHATEEELALADLNQDGIVDIQDAFMAIDMIVDQMGEEARDGIFSRIGVFMDLEAGTFAITAIASGNVSIDVMLRALFEDLMRFIKQLQETKELEERNKRLLESSNPPRRIGQ